jgi:hypothetical protein
MIDRRARSRCACVCVCVCARARVCVCARVDRREEVGTTEAEVDTAFPLCVCGVSATVVRSGGGGATKESTRCNIRSESLLCCHLLGSIYIVVPTTVIFHGRIARIVTILLKAQPSGGRDTAVRHTRVSEGSA